MTEKAKPGSPAELATLFPGLRRLTVLEPFDPNEPERVRSEQSVRIRALNVVELSDMITRLVPVAEAYDAGASPLQLLTTHRETVFELVSVASGRDVAWLRSIDGGDFLQIVVASLEANENFLRTVADLLFGATGARLRKLILPDGPTLSSPLPNTESPTP